MLRRIRLLPIMLLVRVRGRPADIGHERRDNAPARARPRKPPVLFVLRRRIPIPPALLIGVSPVPPPPIMGSVTPPRSALGRSSRQTPPRACARARAW
ncbi:hypothetical protein C8J57DRAFT_1313399 [Mycena rebaudengoi]|nr:hypothetical protein C8J57DRAFT_1313399 [Mycena rebaudengoi]